MTEDFVTLTGNMMSPKHTLGPYGYDFDKAKVGAMSHNAVTLSLLSSILLSE
jgi:hypothetical protein